MAAHFDVGERARELATAIFLLLQRKVPQLFLLYTLRHPVVVETGIIILWWKGTNDTHTQQNSSYTKVF